MDVSILFLCQDESGDMKVHTERFFEKKCERHIEFKQFQKTGWPCGLSCPIRGWVYVGCLKNL